MQGDIRVRCEVETDPKQFDQRLTQVIESIMQAPLQVGKQRQSLPPSTAQQQEQQEPPPSSSSPAVPSQSNENQSNDATIITATASPSTAAPTTSPPHRLYRSTVAKDTAPAQLDAYDSELLKKNPKVYACEGDENFYNSAPRQHRRSASDVDDDGATAKSSKSPAADPYISNFNDRFQVVTEKIRSFTATSSTQDKIEANTELLHLYHDFIFTAKQYGRIIISEVYLPVEQKTIKPVSYVSGILGGEKYIIRNILFKVGMKEEKKKKKRNSRSNNWLPFFSNVAVFIGSAWFIRWK
jgi:hypothetical protein